MAKLARKNQKIFAQNATNNGVFGSLQAGNPTLSNDIEQIQSLPAYLLGWNEATMTGELLPPLEEFQAIQYMITRQMAYFFQEGIPEWGADVTFYEGSLTKENIAGGMRLYSSKTNENKGHPLSDMTNWQKVFDTSDPYAFTSWVMQQLGLKEDLENKVDSLENPSTTTYPTTQAVANAISSINLTPYQLKSNLVDTLTNPSTTTYPTTQAVANAVGNATIRFVTSLPANPDTNLYYAIPE